MAKFKRIKVGSIIKGRQEEGEDGKPLVVDGKPVMKPDSIKIYGNHTFLDGQYLNLESKETQRKNAAKGEASGKLKGEVLASIKARIEKIPDFVRFEVYKVEKNDE